MSKNGSLTSCQQIVRNETENVEMSVKLFTFTYI